MAQGGHKVPALCRLFQRLHMRILKGEAGQLGPQLKALLKGVLPIGVDRIFA